MEHGFNSGEVVRCGRGERKRRRRCGDTAGSARSAFCSAASRLPLPSSSSPGLPTALLLQLASPPTFSAASPPSSSVPDSSSSSATPSFSSSFPNPTNGTLRTPSPLPPPISTKSSSRAAVAAATYPAPRRRRRRRMKKRSTMTRRFASRRRRTKGAGLRE
ncbi:pectinesterase inhibitor 10-like [Zingiber officinale]|uniref:pectinesterase inhibitor 10-like n=1 Tax=Zingiber officinale TaxID=94328 RepID=UPI001C4D2BFF|nr:pectinesterase inhibitor 10-like [Zingiber officinale]